MRTLAPLAYLAWTIALSPCWAGEQERFLEFPSDVATTTVDLSTVQVIQPGRFSVISTTIDNPDVMKFELKVLNTLGTYCARPAGKYPAPADLLTLGPSDMPIESIVVEEKSVTWTYPYERLGGLSSIRYCHIPSEREMQLYMLSYTHITNGFQIKELYDCRRGLYGMFANIDDDPSKAYTSPVRPSSNGEDYYRRVCYAVMREWPAPLAKTSPAPP